jgi:hypothetical protein
MQHTGYTTLRYTFVGYSIINQLTVTGLLNFRPFDRGSERRN